MYVYGHSMSTATGVYEVERTLFVRSTIYDVSETTLNACVQLYQTMQTEENSISRCATYLFCVG